MSPVRFIRNVFEVIGLVAGFVLIPLLPRRLVIALSRGLGAAVYRFSGRDKAVAVANIRAAFGETLDDSRVETLAKESFCCFALVMLDLFWFSLMTRKRVTKYVRLQPGYEWAFGDRPFVYMTAHFGNWEVLGLATALKEGRLLSVAAPLANPVVDRFLRNMRKGTGQLIVNKHGAVRQLIKELKSGGKAALVIDQNTLPEDGGCFVDIFGLPAPMSMAAAGLMQHAGCDAAFVCCVPDGSGGYEARVIERFAGEELKDMSKEEITARIGKAIETAVRSEPGKWLWSYKRWKFIPEGADQGKFPFYSRSV